MIAIRQLFVSGGNVIFCKIQNGSLEASELAVSPNDDVSLNCSVFPQGVRASRVTWTGGQRNYSKDIVSAPGLWSHLRLSNISVEDAGKYKCEVSNEGHKDVCAVTLQVNCELHQGLINQRDNKEHKSREIREALTMI